MRGLQEFVDSVLPTLVSRIPNLELRVVGSVCDRIRTDLPSCRLLGRVDDLTPHYEESWVVVNTMVFGTGLKLVNAP